MVLEATMICCDNSDYLRNGDFAPSRLEAQQDAVNLLAGAKTQSNPENTVGVLTMAGAGVEVRVALTPDVGKVLAQSVSARPMMTHQTLSFSGLLASRRPPAACLPTPPSRRHTRACPHA